MLENFKNAPCLIRQRPRARAAVAVVQNWTSGIAQRRDASSYNPIRLLREVPAQSFALHALMRGCGCLSAECLPEGASL
ncbi:hypothetical protein FVA81_01095 (plasmid) [Rhizobium sp. WL3]|uniref:hypothetical protein n=1 Tax=Rhizobium sp. WL3 TaxID=2603277 RepID=UPI0011C201F7|nr:hypothetical protein [Rhizobium sp. WL3]QEE43276.1 hypothetical protein FVA81_01095 [Rhizobium sp. WL3]